MGNGQSSSTADPRYTSATRAFATHELEELKSLFVSLALLSQSDGQFINPSVFKAYIGIEGSLGDRMFDLVSQKRNDQKLTFEDLVIAKGSYEKGTNDEIEDFIYQLADVTGDGTLNRSDLELVLAAILDNIGSKRSDESGSKSESIQIFLDAAKFSGDNEESQNTMTFQDFRSWLKLVPSARKFLGSLLMPSDRGSQIPNLVHEDIAANTILLKEYAWHIGGALPHQELDGWKLLYHSGVHGQSFNTFLGNISNGTGPTVLIIKDKEGYIYGGYASQPWERHADFYGDMKSFLFQLHPKASLFRPSGANNFIQWCAMNFSSESIPNGIGFGGRVNHFALFLSANFDEGHTFTSPTFNNPCLSKTSKIVPDVIECWGVVVKEELKKKSKTESEAPCWRDSRKIEICLKWLDLPTQANKLPILLKPGFGS